MGHCVRERILILRLGTQARGQPGRKDGEQSCEIPKDSIYQYISLLHLGTSLYGLFPQHARSMHSAQGTLAPIHGFGCSWWVATINNLTF